jgi:hypothetical protein
LSKVQNFLKNQNEQIYNSNKTEKLGTSLKRYDLPEKVTKEDFKFGIKTIIGI